MNTKVTQTEDGYTVVFGKNVFRVEVGSDQAKNEKEAIAVAEKNYASYKENPLKTD